MFEIFKRVVNDEILKDIATDSQIDLDHHDETHKNHILEKRLADEKIEFIKNYETTQIRAQSILIFAKHWKPFDQSSMKSI